MNAISPHRPSAVIPTPGFTVAHRAILKLLGVVDALSKSHTKKTFTRLSAGTIQGGILLTEEILIDI